MAHKKLGISNKYQLLLLLTIILVVSSSIYIFQAAQFFENNKIVYVKGSGVAAAQFLAFLSLARLRSGD